MRSLAATLQQMNLKNKLEKRTKWSLFTLTSELNAHASDHILEFFIYSETK